MFYKTDKYFCHDMEMLAIENYLTLIKIQRKIDAFSFPPFLFVEFEVPDLNTENNIEIAIHSCVICRLSFIRGIYVICQR